MKRFKDVYDKNTPKPEYVALGMVKRPEGWSVVRLAMRGGQVLEDELTEPNLFIIASENFKLLAAKEVLSQ